MNAEKDSFITRLIFGVLLCSLVAVIGTAVSLVGGADSNATNTLSEDQYVLVSTTAEQVVDAPIDPELEIRRKQKQEKAALTSYARKVQAELEREEVVAGKFNAISVHLVRDGFAIDLRTSRAGALFEQESTILTNFAAQLLSRSAEYLMPFKNQLEVFSYSETGTNQDKNNALALASQRAFAAREALIGAGVEPQRINLVGARTNPLTRNQDEDYDAEQQVVVLMRFTDFSITRGKSKEEEVKDLFRSFDKRSAHKDTQLVGATPDSRETTGRQTTKTEAQTSKNLSSLPKDKIFGGEPAFDLRDPL